MTKQFSWAWLCGYMDGNSLWFRLFGWGLVFSNGGLLFSERYGYTKYLPIGFGWRVKLLIRR